MVKQSVEFFLLLLVERYLQKGVDQRFLPPCRPVTQFQTPKSGTVATAFGSRVGSSSRCVPLEKMRLGSLIRQDGVWHVCRRIQTKGARFGSCAAVDCWGVIRTKTTLQHSWTAEAMVQKRVPWFSAQLNSTQLSSLESVSTLLECVLFS
jgi:hypothetical protein